MVTLLQVWPSLRSPAVFPRKLVNIKEFPRISWSHRNFTLFSLIQFRGFYIDPSVSFFIYLFSCLAGFTSCFIAIHLSCINMSVSRSSSTSSGRSSLSSRTSNTKTSRFCSYNYTTQSIPIAPQPPRSCCTTTVPDQFTATPVLTAPSVTFKTYLHQLSRWKSTYTNDETAPKSSSKRSLSNFSVPPAATTVAADSSPGSGSSTPSSRSSVGSLYVSFPSISDEP